MKNISQICAAIFLFLPVESVAFEKSVISSANSSADDYVPLRCASWYLASLEWVGENRMGTETANTIKGSFDILVHFGLVVRMHEMKSDDAEAISLTVQRDVRNMADLYIDRMQSNYARVGEAFAQDAMILEDMEFCKAVVEQISN